MWNAETGPVEDWHYLSTKEKQTQNANQVSRLNFGKQKSLHPQSSEASTQCKVRKCKENIWITCWNALQSILFFRFADISTSQVFSVYSKQLSVGLPNLSAPHRKHFSLFLKLLRQHWKKKVFSVIISHSRLGLLLIKWVRAIGPWTSPSKQIKKQRVIPCNQDKGAFT